MSERMVHVPMRRCVGCGQMSPQADLVRLAVGSAGEIVVDSLRNRGGRGAYLCSQPQCLRLALARRSLERSLKIPVVVDRQGLAEDLVGIVV